MIPKNPREGSQAIHPGRSDKGPWNDVSASKFSIMANNSSVAVVSSVTASKITTMEITYDNILKAITYLVIPSKEPDARRWLTNNSANIIHTISEQQKRYESGADTVNVERGPGASKGNENGKEKGKAYISIVRKFVVDRDQQLPSWRIAVDELFKYRIMEDDPSAKDVDSPDDQTMFAIFRIVCRSLSIDTPCDAFEMPFMDFGIRVGWLMKWEDDILRISKFDRDTYASSNSLDKLITLANIIFNSFAACTVKLIDRTVIKSGNAKLKKRYFSS